VKRSKITFVLSSVLALAPLTGVTAGAAQAAVADGIKPDVVARVWQEETHEYASVSLNGKELVCFRGQAGAGLAADKAEDLAGKLQDLFEDRKFSPDELVPAKAGTTASLQIEGTTVISVDPTTTTEAQTSGREIGFKMANAIRSACDAPSLPASFLKPSDHHDKLAGCFSGTASWYGPHFHGRKTSDGSRFDQEKLTAAHRSLPFGTRLLVTNRKTGQSCVVKVNDRGPFIGHRVIDLSKGAARQLKMLSSGVAMVDCLVLGSN